MELRPFGTTGLTVSALGLGAGQIGSASITDGDAAAVLGTALDLGITLIDTAAGYGLSEERIGTAIGHRRDEFVLSSKAGWSDDGTVWDAAEAARRLDASLANLRTDVIDVYHLHSTSLDEAESWEMIGVIEAAREAGKVRFVAYSGDNADIVRAASEDRFSSIETSVNIADQFSLHHAIPAAAAAGKGVIGKRPLANAVWRYAERPTGVYGDYYWDRLRELAYHVDLEPNEFALRFSAHAPGVSSVITGTARPANLSANAAAVEKGPLPADVQAHVAERWHAVGSDWPGMV